MVADLRRRLPGRGVWVTADAGHVRDRREEAALRPRLRGARSRSSPASPTGSTALLRESALSALSLARKAGALVTGFAKVDAALGDGQGRRR